MSETRIFRFDMDRLMQPGTVFETEDVDYIRKRWVVTLLEPDPQAAWKFMDLDSLDDPEAWPTTMLVTARRI